MKLMKQFNWMLLLLITLGAVLRLVWLNTYPPLNRDELSIGYNAYSILKTHRDEHGVGPWPLTFRAFGDYKLPGTVYLVAVGVKLFGLSPWGIRILPALFGVGLIPLTYLLAIEIFDRKRVGLLAALLVTFSLWHIHGSRSVYEPMVSLTVVTAGLWCLYRAFRAPIYFLPAVVLGGLSLFFYNSPLFWWPVVLVAFVFLNRDKLRGKIAWWLGLFIYGLFLITALFGVRGVNQSRAMTTVFFNPVVVAEVREQVDLIHKAGWPLPLARIIINKVSVGLWRAGSGYVSALDWRYLFFEGDDNPWHSLRAIRLGNLNIFLLPFVVFGIMKLWEKSVEEKKKRHILLAVFLLAAPLANAFTIDAPITNRLLELHLGLLLLAAFGVDEFWRLGKSGFRKMILIAGATGYGLVVAYFIFMYVSVFPYVGSSYWNSGVPELVAKVGGVSKDKMKVFVSRDVDLAYIYWAVYGGWEPKRVQNAAVRSGSGDDYDVVAELGNYYFGLPAKVGQLTDEDMEKMFANPNESILIVGRPGTYDSMGKVVQVVTDRRGDIEWEVVEAYGRIY